MYLIALGTYLIFKFLNTSCKGFKVRFITNDESSLNNAFFGPVDIFSSENAISNTFSYKG